MRELRHADAGRSQVLSPARCDNSRISALVSPASTERRFHLVNLRRALTRPIIAQIVDIHAVDHVRDAPLASHLVEPGEQFVLAVEAAVGTVLDVVRIVELARLDVFVPESHSRANSSASRLCDSGNDAESAVIAIAWSPKAWCAAHARYAESAPPE